MAMKEEPPLAAECHDKFLIQSTSIVPELETLSLSDIVSPSLVVLANCHLNFPSPLRFAQLYRIRDDDIVEHYRWRHSLANDGCCLFAAWGNVYSGRGRRARTHTTGIGVQDS